MKDTKQLAQIARLRDRYSTDVILYIQDLAAF